MCSCTQTAVATVTPRVPSSVHVNGHPQGLDQRKSAGSNKSRLAPSLKSVSKKSSQWSSYDLEIRDFDEFSEGDPIRGPCEIESDDEICDDSLIDKYNNNNKGGHHQHHSHHLHPNSLLSENSKWTVTVRLYAKAADQRSSDIPSVEETGSHYSSGEWHGKSGSSQGSRDSAKRPPKPPAPTPNGIIPKEYQKSKQKTVAKKSARSNRLHHSHSERPLTKEELAHHERIQLQQALNPSYAWGYGQSQTNGLGPQQTEHKPMANGVPLNGLIPPNGFSVLQGAPTKYTQPSSLSTYLSLGTNHYRQARSSLRERRRDPDVEENWQSLCDSKIPPTRPLSSHHTHRQHQYREFNDLCDTDSALRSPSPIDSLSTDYIVDGEIVEDFSGSTHSLTNVGVKTPTIKVVEHLPDQEVCMESHVPIEPKKQAARPRAALRRHRSEPFHFLV